MVNGRPDRVSAEEKQMSVMLCLQNAFLYSQHSQNKALHIVLVELTR